MSEIINFQNLPLVVGVDLGGTQVRVAVLQRATIFVPAPLNFWE